MTDDFWRGLAALPAVALALALLVAVLFGLAWVWGRFALPHWWISGPQRKARPASEVLRRTEVAGGHARTLRRLARLGPYGFYVIRYAPGSAEVRPEHESIP